MRVHVPSHQLSLLQRLERVKRRISGADSGLSRSVRPPTEALFARATGLHALDSREARSYTARMKSTSDARIAAIVNLSAFTGMLVVNILANSVPINNVTTGELSDAYPNLFVPVGTTFAVWGVIWLLLGVHLLMQIRTAFAKKGGEPDFAESAGRNPWSPGVVGFWFTANMILNAGWIFAWHHRLVGVSVVIMLGLLATLIVMHRRLSVLYRMEEVIRPKGNLRLARVPISVYFGWISIATIANITAFLVSIDWDGFGLPDVFWTIAMIAVGFGLTVAMLIRHQDVAFAAVVVWAFAGIAARRIIEGTPEGPAILVAAIVAGLLIIVFGAVTATRRFVRR